MLFLLTKAARTSRNWTWLHHLCFPRPRWSGRPVSPGCRSLSSYWKHRNTRQPASELVGGISLPGALQVLHPVQETRAVLQQVQLALQPVTSSATHSTTEQQRPQGATDQWQQLVDGQGPLLRLQVRHVILNHLVCDAVRKLLTQRFDPTHTHTRVDRKCDQCVVIKASVGSYLDLPGSCWLRAGRAWMRLSCCASIDAHPRSSDSGIKAVFLTCSPPQRGLKRSSPSSPSPRPSCCGCFWPQTPLLAAVAPGALLALLSHRR